jgi:hypothetical protein
MHFRTIWWVTGCLAVVLAAVCTAATLSSRQEDGPAGSPSPSPPVPRGMPHIPSGPVRIETVAPVSGWALAAGADGRAHGLKAPQNGDHF